MNTSGASKLIRSFPSAGLFLAVGLLIELRTNLYHNEVRFIKNRVVCQDAVAKAWCLHLLQ